MPPVFFLCGTHLYLGNKKVQFLLSIIKINKIEKTNAQHATVQSLYYRINAYLQLKPDILLKKNSKVAILILLSAHLLRLGMVV